MNKVFLIIQREFLNRVQKKSFLVATILIPLIFPSIMAVLFYVKKQQDETAAKKIIHYIDEGKIFEPDSKKFEFVRETSTLAEAKENLKKDEQVFALLYIPEIDISKPQGIQLFTKSKISLGVQGDINYVLEERIKELKMERFKIDRAILDSLKTSVSLKTTDISGDVEQESNSGWIVGVGVAAGILMYMFIFIYGAQIMQGIIEEKTSKVVEVIVSSVRPFQLMLGKILGLASVGLLQFIIWIILITTLTGVVFSYFGIDSSQQQMVSQMTPEAQAAQNQFVMDLHANIDKIPFTYLICNFLFFFLGGYLIYGAMFAAVGSAVDSPAEAQQFMFPITLPMLIAYFGLFTFIIDDPQGPISVWLSIIPFTSPIAMMGRLGFGVPLWQLILSQVLLIGGFILTTWIAARIYRVGILMHGTKVNYKVLAKWFMMKN
ncbi:ABC transporter permease [Pseudochryseolinea flava]|uniref:ABC transporter permease n=1 Tax=Pseudochryseolinea flava TaxID=2059302 RepID=A0A364Y8I5_9BACT|nr:ABC transporter permease [Pseudochryseolinea flava]RAW03426.1 ABC transporter permease [Pseudochryseolinea flava]